MGRGLPCEAVNEDGLLYLKQVFLKFIAHEVFGVQGVGGDFPAPGKGRTGIEQGTFVGHFHNCPGYLAVFEGRGSIRGQGIRTYDVFSPDGVRNSIKAVSYTHLNYSEAAVRSSLYLAGYYFPVDFHGAFAL